MTQQQHQPQYPDPYHDHYSKTVLGFWLFLVTDFVLFGVLFATYIVLGNRIHGGPNAMQLFDGDFAFLQSLLMLLIASAAGIGGAAAHRKNKEHVLIAFGLTFLFSCIFMWLEYADFYRLISAGNNWEKSAFLSAFFTLLGTHGLHVILGLIWIPVLLIPVFKEGVSKESILRLSCLRMFFQFLNIVWIFIYAFVYFINRGAV